MQGEDYYYWHSYEEINEKCPLSVAIESDSIEIVKFLVKHGADINTILNHHGWYGEYTECPLSIAIQAHSTEVVKFLVEHGADVNVKLFRDYCLYEECPLSSAIYSNSIEIVEFLVEHGADVNMKLKNKDILHALLVLQSKENQQKLSHF